ncbi:cache and HAMP domain-containing protein [bacterium]|nr:cache and HAMP domain-containing protein [bacterium]
MEFLPRFGLGIREKLTFFFLIVAVIPVGFLGWQAFNEQKNVIYQEVTRSHRELSNILAHGIYENLEFSRRLLNCITDLDVVKRMNSSVAEDFFKALVKNYKIFKILYLVNSEKKIIACTDSSVVLPPDWLFTNAIKRSYQGSLSEVFKTNDGSPYMTLESVIKSQEKGEIAGVLISEIDLTYVRELLRDSLKRSQSKGLVLDEAGSVIARSAPEAEALGISSTETQEGDVTKMKDLGGTRYLITAVSLKKFDFYQAPNWTIILQIPEQEAFSAAYELKGRILSLLIATAIFSLIFAVLIAKSFTAPLLNLIEWARFIGKGDFSKEILPSSQDEIGELTGTFNEMRLNLRETKADLDYRIIQLSTLYEVGNAISSIFLQSGL